MSDDLVIGSVVPAQAPAPPTAHPALSGFNYSGPWWKPDPLTGWAPPRRPSAHIRAELLYNDEGLKGRRAVPDGSGAVAAWGSDWARIIELLANPISDSCPYIMHRATTWILRARFDGDQDDAFGLIKAPEFHDQPSPCRAAWGADWTRILQLLEPQIAIAVPEIRFGKAPYWIPRARPNGIRIEIFADEYKMQSRVLDQMADLREGPPIANTGHLWIEFFDDDDRLGDRLRSTVVELRDVAQIHGGRLDWI